MAGVWHGSWYRKTWRSNRFTGLSSRELERKLRELGISYYMAKPLQRNELHSLLVHMAGRSCVQGCRRTANPIINPI
jgi:hypothetical protein